MIPLPPQDDWCPPLWIKNLKVYIEWDRKPLDASIREAKLTHEDTRPAKLFLHSVQTRIKGKFERETWFTIHKINGDEYDSFEEAVKAAFFVDPRDFETSLERTIRHLGM